MVLHILHHNHANTWQYIQELPWHFCTVFYNLSYIHITGVPQWSCFFHTQSLGCGNSGGEISSSGHSLVCSGSIVLPFCV